MVGEYDDEFSDTASNKEQNYSEYMISLKKSGLCNDLNWKGEVLSRFQEMFHPLLDDTEYHLERSGEKTQVIYELKVGNCQGRLLGFKALQKEIEKGNGKGRIRAFFNHEIYVMVKSIIELPDNDLPNKSQEHVYITLEKLWNVMCIIVNKKDKLL